MMEAAVMPPFDVTAEELSDLVTQRDAGSLEVVEKKYGGYKGLATRLRCDLKSGLSAEEQTEGFATRRRLLGNNRVEAKAARSFFSFWFEALRDKTLIVLICASIVSIVLGVALPPPGEDTNHGWVEGTAILLAVLLVSGVTAVNDFSKDKKFRKLSAIAEDHQVNVFRDGKELRISTFDVVCGDLVRIETGDLIPADMFLIYGEDLTIDESAMTGESEVASKDPEDPFLLATCMVMSGVGLGVVIAVGPYSQWGRIKASLVKPESKTPLQKKLGDLAEFISKLGVGASILIFMALILRWIITDFGMDGKTWQWNEGINKIVQCFILAVTILVVAVPEGLPLAVTIAFAYSMVQMIKDQNLVRHLAACETMGGATQICVDKTGTLTQNRMTVVKLWVAGKLFDRVPQLEELDIAKSVLEKLNDGIALNSTAYIDKLGSGKPRFIGAQTEGALLTLSAKLGIDYSRVRHEKEGDIIRILSFSSDRKRMSTIVKHNDGFRMYVKGASELILARCQKTLTAEDESRDLSVDEKETLERDLIENWSKQGQRTLALAYKDLPPDYVFTEIDVEHDVIEKDLLLIGIVGIEDPVREEVPRAVRDCQRADITVRMLTGDNVLTACCIAKQCGILFDDGIVLEGPKWRLMSPQERDKVIPRLQVIARCSPEDKLTFVRRLRELGEVVAVTGDGTNDAPQLREADVGFAMGISGTEVAKDASDIILLDDNFSSIAKAVVWGRNVYDSIRKFVQFQLTINLVAVLVAFIGAISTGFSPLNAIQLLWVNLIMDTLAALALATERPTPELMDRPPYGSHQPLITFRMWRFIIVQGLYQLSVLVFTLYAGPSLPFLHVGPDDVTLLSTLVFNSFIFCQIFNEFNARKLNDEKNPFVNLRGNYIFISVLFVIIAVQVVIVEFTYDFAKVTPLDFSQWIYCIIVGSISLPLGFLMRFIPVPKERSGFPSLVLTQQQEHRIHSDQQASPLPPSRSELGQANETTPLIEAGPGNKVWPREETVLVPISM
jgi:calcium-translocating P-type ATPase